MNIQSAWAQSFIKNTLYTVLIVIVAGLVSIRNTMELFQYYMAYDRKYVETVVSAQSELMRRLVVVDRPYKINTVDWKAMTQLTNRLGFRLDDESLRAILPELQTAIIDLEDHYSYEDDNSEFFKLIAHLVDLQDYLSLSAQQYNRTVIMYNDYIQGFPHRIIAGVLEYSPVEPFHDLGELENVPALVVE